MGGGVINQLFPVSSRTCREQQFLAARASDSLTLPKNDQMLFDMCSIWNMCVCSVGLITRFGHSPTPGQLQRRQGRSASCLFARKISSVSIFLASVHMRELSATVSRR